MNKNELEQKILLVDDDSKNLQVAMSILKDYNIIYAQSGTKALELLSTKDFDLILLDIVMPGMDGYEVCEKIKQNEKTKDIPLIFLTVKDDEKDIVKGFELGAVDYIVKPFYSAVLLKRVETHLFLSRSVKNLKSIVSEQVTEIRQKDKILFQQSKITALSEIVDVISSQWKTPLGLIKMHTQSLELKALAGNVNADSLHEETLYVLNHVDLLERKINDFRDCFKYGTPTDNLNIKVVCDGVLFKLKEILSKENIKVKIHGDVSVHLDIVENELKHILTKLIYESIEAFHKNNVENKKIDIHIHDNTENINIIYSDNSGLLTSEELIKIFDHDYAIGAEKGLGLYMTKIFVEKNSGEILVDNLENGVCFNLGFSKNS